MRHGRTWALVCMLALVSASAYADRVHLKSGRTLEGEVIDRGDQVEIKLKFGSITVPKDEIASIEPVEDPAETYRKKVAELADDDADGHFQLAQWCQMRGLEEETRAELLKTIEINPEHAEARALLGHVKIDEKWVDTTTTNIVNVTNQMPVKVEVVLDGEAKASVEASGSYQLRSTPGEHGLAVVLSDDRQVKARVAFEPGRRYSLLIPVPQPEHVLRYSRDGFYLFPAEAEELVYRDGVCQHALLKDGARLATLDGSPFPGPTVFDARDLGEALGLDGTFAKIQEVVEQRGARARPDATGGARLLVAYGLFAILDKDDLEDVKEGKSKLKSIRLVCEEEARYGVIDSIEAGSDFELGKDGDVALTLGSLTVKVGLSSVAVRSTDRETRGDYVIMPESVVRLGRGSGRRAAVVVQEGSVKPLGEAQPPVVPTPSKPGTLPRMPRGAMPWGATGYLVTRQPAEDDTQTALYSERLVVLLDSEPL